MCRGIGPGTFEPRIVPKHARRVDGFDEAIISLYAKDLRPARSRRIWPRSTTWTCPGI